MAVNFSVSTFRSSFDGVGLTDPTKFSFRFTGMPRCLTKKYAGALMDDLVIHTRRSQLPELSIDTNEGSIGPRIKYAGATSTNDLQIEVFSSGNLWERKLFAAWQKGVIDYGIPGIDNSHFGVGYHNDYTIDGELDIFNEANERTSTIVFSKCWPSNVGSIDMDWGQHSTPVYFSVNISYSQWNFKEGLGSIYSSKKGTGGGYSKNGSNLIL